MKRYMATMPNKQVIGAKKRIQYKREEKGETRLEENLIKETKENS